jgi:hypothetical protein
MRCKSCNGEYFDQDAQGVKYFHTCPLSVPEPDRRDENIVSVEAGGRRNIKREGLGVERV